MPEHKNSTTDLRRRYPVFFEVGLVLSLATVILLFSVPLESTGALEIVESQQEVVLVEEVEQTHQAEKPPPPPKAPAPIEVANEAVTEDIVLDFDMDLDLSEVVAPPPPPPPAPRELEAEPPPEDKPEIFVVVEEPPELIGGIEGLQARIQYPELARMAEIQGTVFVQFVIDEQGNVTHPICVRDPGGGTCEEALRAVREAKFKPGRQRGKPVRVRFSLPVKFRLR